MTKIFVYGTLRKGYYWHEALLPQEPETTGCVEGTLWMMGTLPVMVPGVGCLVVGEVYSVDDRQLARLERLEASAAYHSEPCTVSTPEGPVEAIAWIYDAPPVRGVQVPSGDFADAPGVRSWEVSHDHTS